MQPFLAAFLFPKTKDKLLCPNNIYKMYCLFWAQDTNFKAIHNQVMMASWSAKLFVLGSRYKFQSNSQPKVFSVI